MSKFYEHFVEPVPLKPDYHSGLTHTLVSSLSEMESSFVPDSYMAWDTETSSLSPEEGFIVGISYTFNGKDGYYVPINHSDIKLGLPALELFYKMVRLSRCSVLFNARFDMRFLEFSDPRFDLSMINFLDVQNLSWLSDTNVPMPSLDKSARRFLGWEMQSFKEAFREEVPLQYTPAAGAVKYASTDALATYNLLPVLLPYYRESGMAAKLDNECLFIFMRLENELQLLSQPVLSELLKDTVERMRKLESALYKEVGYSFKIGSSRDLTTAFLQLGIDTGERTKAGYMVTNITALENYQKVRGDVPFLNTLIEYKRVNKFYNSYITRFLEIAQESPRGCRFSYKLQTAPTGRTASGTDAKNPFFAPVNVQSIPKPDTILYGFRSATEEERRSGLDVLGFMFEEDCGSLPLVEGMSPYLNIRKALLPDPGSLCVSIDMKAEELRIVANLFGERKWINSFLTDEDIHRTTAISIFGESEYDHDKREKAKVASYGILYGTSAYGFQRRFPDMSIPEAEDFISRFKRALPSISNGQRRALAKARKEGTVYTFFGRPRRVKYYLQSADYKDRSFGMRTVNNTLVQGAAADILKLILVRLWKEVFTKYPTVKFMSTIHDEVTFSVPRDIIDEVLPILVKCHTVQLTGWEVPMECSVSVGTTFGTLFPFVEVDGRWVPEEEERREKPSESIVEMVSSVDVPEDIFKL